MELDVFLSKLPRVIGGKKVIKWKPITNLRDKITLNDYYAFHDTSEIKKPYPKHIEENFTVESFFGNHPEQYLAHRAIFKQRVG